MAAAGIGNVFREGADPIGGPEDGQEIEIPGAAAARVTQMPRPQQDVANNATTRNFSGSASLEVQCYDDGPTP
jgi:hypothetical protein